MTARRVAGILLWAALLAGQSPALAGRPAVVMILLDTTRADRFGSHGSGIDTTPVLDALGAEGAQFMRHFANSHATRPSFPQILSGRYHHPSVLRPFQPDSHPRDYPFLQPDSGARLLTDLLREAGYHLLGVTAHPWVDPASRMGRAFDRLEYRAAPSARGHADAAEIVDRAITLWDARPADRPTFLYVHLLDLHTPRWLPGEAPEFLAPGPPWTERFGPDGEPRFGAERRAWDFTDARDFDARDREVYRAIYDTLLRYTDGQLGRLLARVRRDDPALAQTLVVLLADHGEQLGEEGRLKHGDSLVDGVQHTPLIVAGAGIGSGQRIEAFTENVDIAPTLAHLLDLDAPPGAFDGRRLLDRDGRVCFECLGRSAVYYAWSDYAAVRTDRWLLRVDPAGSPAARCRGGETTLWRLEGSERALADEPEQRERLRRKVSRRLEWRQARLERGLATPPIEPFFVPVPHWRLAHPDAVTCVPIDGGVAREALTTPGWLLVRSGLVVTAGDAKPLALSVTVPDGRYDVAAGVRPLGRWWRLPGMFGRARDALHDEDASAFVALGKHEATGRRLTIDLPAAAGIDQRIVNLRLTPVGARTKDAPAIDEEHHERLRTLGYVE
jgi:choline-sulfatase